MAKCPFALQKIIPAGSNDPPIVPRVAILHTAVTNADSLYDYFNGPSGGVESHFYIRNDGTIEQYRDTEFQADANLMANDFAVSIETAGFASDDWNSAQMIAIKKLLVWLHEEHDIPLRKILQWDGSGVGYHVLFGAPGPWTPVAKSCPGANRIKQFSENLVPWMASVNQSKPPIPLANFVVAFQNLDFGRPWTAHKRNINEVMNEVTLGRKTDVGGFAELRKSLSPLMKLKYKVIQYDPEGEEVGTEAILVRRSSKFKILTFGTRLSAIRLEGQLIGWRRFPYIVLDTGFNAPVGCIFAHFPPLRMQDSQLDETYDKTLNTLIDDLQRGFNCSIHIAGDFNERKEDDPARLSRDQNFVWHGSRIDLASISRGLNKRLAKFKEKLDPERKDQHPAIYSAFK